MPQLIVDLTQETYDRYKAAFKALQRLDDDPTDEQLIAQLTREARAIIHAGESQIAQNAVVAPIFDVPAVPTVDDLQIRLALTEMGLREAVEMAISGVDQETRDWYERAKKFKRTDAMVAALALALNVSDEQLDALWALAATK